MRPAHRKRLLRIVLPLLPLLLLPVLLLRLLPLLLLRLLRLLLLCGVLASAKPRLEPAAVAGEAREERA